MIIGIGTDIIEIERVAAAVKNPRFLSKVFTPDEIAYCDNLPERFAGIFAAKEAIAKAMGTGFRKLLPRDLEIRRTDLGQPIYNNAEYCFSVSISHCKTYAVAFVIACAKGNLI
jgi:holo-[acyl-carrier protein] synthase